MSASIDAHIAADKSSMVSFLKGKASVTGKFWLVNLLRFKPGGEEEYRRYADALKEPMAAVGARPIFASYTCFTVVDGAGTIFPADGVFIGEYPSPAALIEMNKSKAYIDCHKHRAAALSDTAMYAIPPAWGAARDSMPQREANASIKAPPSGKTKQQLEAINGEPGRFMAFMNDDRFEPAEKPQVWMLNFLRFEPGEGKALYQEYGIRAQSHISSMKSNEQGQSGGLALMATSVHTLRGPQFDTIGIMRYPSRKDFLSYAMGQGGAGGSKKKGSVSSASELVAEGFKLREAGLAVQGLVCMLPEHIYDAAAKSRL